MRDRIPQAWRDAVAAKYPLLDLFRRQQQTFQRTGGPDDGQ